MADKSKIEWCDSSWSPKTAGVACFVKQLGAFPVAVDIRVPNLDRWRIVLKDRKGGDMSEWAEDLRVRQFPEAR